MAFFDWFTRRPDGIRSPWAEPDHLAHLTWSELFPGVDPENLPVTRDSAMQIPALAKARNTLVSLARFPLYAINAAGAAEKQPWITQQPDPSQPALMTWTWIVDELLFHGRAFLYVLEDTGGRVTRARVLPQTQIDFNDAGEPIGYRGQRYSGRWVRIDGMHEGILTTGRQAIRYALALEQAYRRASSNPVPAIDLHQTTPTPKLSKADRDQLLSAWVSARRGANGAVGYTTHNIEARALGMHPEQLLTAGRTAAAVDMARIVGVPAWAVDATLAGSSLTYSNVVDRRRDLIDMSFGLYMAPIEARLSLDDVLPRGTWCRFNADSWTRGDLKARAEAYVAARDAGIYTADDITRAERGLPVEG